MGFDVRTGRVVFAQRMTEYDVWTLACTKWNQDGVCDVPESEDWDFAQGVMHVPGVRWARLLVPLADHHRSNFKKRSAPVACQVVTRVRCSLQLKACRVLSLCASPKHRCGKAAPQDYLAVAQKSGYIHFFTVTPRNAS